MSTPQPPPPAATEADLKVFRAACESANAVIYNRHGRPWWSVEASETNEAGAKVIAAHTSAAVAEAVKTLESELEIRTRQRDYWQEERNKLLKTNGDLARKYDFEAYHAVESERDSLRACVVRMREALREDKISADIIAAENAQHGRILQIDRDCNFIRARTYNALAIVPADLADCVVLKKSEWDECRKAGQDFADSHFKTPDREAALEAENRALRAQTLRFHEALNEIENVETAWPDFNEHEQLKECTQTAKRALAPKEGNA